MDAISRGLSSYGVGLIEETARVKQELVAARVKKLTTMSENAKKTVPHERADLEVYVDGSLLSVLQDYPPKSGLLF